MTTGERIKRRREELGMTQEELALKIGYKSRSSINKIEIGAQDLVQSKIKTVADALSTTPGYIMGWTDYHSDYEKKPTVDGEHKTSDRDIMFALWGDTTDVDADDLEDVKRYAAFIRERKKKK